MGFSSTTCASHFKISSLKELCIPSSELSIPSSFSIPLQLVCNVNIVHGAASKLFFTTVLFPTYAEGEGAFELLSSSYINKNRKSQFHIKELFLRGSRSTEELISSKKSIPRNRVPTTMNVVRYSRCPFSVCPCPKFGGMGGGGG